MRTESGTKYALETIREGLTWDIEGRKGNIPASGGQLIGTEFDYKGENQIV